MYLRHFWWPKGVYVLHFLCPCQHGQAHIDALREDETEFPMVFSTPQESMAHQNFSFIFVLPL